MIEEENNLGAEINEIQGLLIPHLEVMQYHIKVAKELIASPSILIVDLMTALVTQLQIEQKSLKLIHKNCDNTIVIMLKQHKEFIDHFGLHPK